MARRPGNGGVHASIAIPRVSASRRTPKKGILQRIVHECPQADAPERLISLLAHECPQAEAPEKHSGRYTLRGVKRRTPESTGASGTVVINFSGKVKVVQLQKPLL